MKFTSMISISALGLLAGMGTPIQLDAQPRYNVTDLGPAGSPFAQATWLNDYGLVTGLGTAADGTQHAIVWYWGTITDISKPGLQGPNSSAGGVNNYGQVIGAAETSSKDPNTENFCGYGTTYQCLAFLWDSGVMTALPTLGGTNATVGAMNNMGQVVGMAENSHRDPSCRPGTAVNGTGPQVLDFEAVMWGPSPGQIRELAPPAPDTVGMAYGINDSGQVVGATGLCGNTVLPGFAAAPHAVMWDADGTVHTLPNLGGSAPDTTVLGPGNLAFAINNHGIIAGQSALSNNTTFHPVLWQDEIIADLGVLPGDLVGASLDLNNRGDVVGASVSAPGPATGNPRAFLWQNGVMTDLNTLVPADSPLYLLTAFAINDSGDIVGFGATEDGDLHGFLATLCHESSSTCSGSSNTAERIGRQRVGLSENARNILLRSGLRGR